MGESRDEGPVMGGSRDEGPMMGGSRDEGPVMGRSRDEGPVICWGVSIAVLMNGEMHNINSVHCSYQAVGSCSHHCSYIAMSVNCSGNAMYV